MVYGDVKVFILWGRFSSWTLCHFLILAPPNGVMTQQLINYLCLTLNLHTKFDGSTTQPSWNTRTLPVWCPFLSGSFWWASLMLTWFRLQAIQDGSHFIVAVNKSCGIKMYWMTLWQAQCYAELWTEMFVHTKNKRLYRDIVSRTKYQSEVMKC